MQKAKYVSIGYSAGAIGMIEAIRSKDKKSKILAVTKEKHLAYGRPAIVDYAMGKIKDDGIAYGGCDYTEMRNVETIVGVEAVKINPAEHRIELSNGEILEYEKLLLNMGGKPISPPIPGKELEGVTHFFTLDDAKEMRMRVLEKGAKKAVVIGGGLIGLKAVEALTSLGVRVAIVELASMILSRALDPVSSQMMSEKMHACCVDVYTSNEVVEIIGNKKVEKVRLKTGEEIETDLVYIAIGVTPDSKLAEAAGLKVNRGIEVNRYMQTSEPDIYAAGDAAKGYNFLSGENMVIAIWPVARKMGFFAGSNMMGNKMKYDGSIVMNSLYFEDFYTISYGETNPQNPEAYEILEKKYNKGRSYRKFIIKDDRIAGAVFVNDISRAGIVKSLIYERMPVSKYKDLLLKEDSAFIHLPKEYRDAVYTRPYAELIAQN
jgi:NAD(P)H-nitrite reductase large subunit